MLPEELLELVEAEVVAAEDEEDIIMATRLKPLKGSLPPNRPAQQTHLLPCTNKSLQLLEIHQDRLAEEEAEEGRGRANEVAQDTVPLELLCRARHGDLAAISQ